MLLHGENLWYIQKGYTLVGEFSCKGLDTYGLLKTFGGINKGRPNEQDMEKAREFARKIKDMRME